MANIHCQHGGRECTWEMGVGHSLFPAVHCILYINPPSTRHTAHSTTSEFQERITSVVRDRVELGGLKTTQLLTIIIFLLSFHLLIRGILNCFVAEILEYLH